MKIAILSRNKRLHSVSRLLEEGKRLKIECDVIHPLHCQIVIDQNESRLLVGNQTLPQYHAILPRIGASITDYGLAVVKQFELLGTYALNGSQAISDSRDKLRALQILSRAGIQVPPTVLSRQKKDLRSAVQAVGGLPVILKVLRGTQGIGVMLVPTLISLESVMDTLRGMERDVLIQKYLEEADGTDYRVFVVAGKVIAAMVRKAPEGEFRSNVHQGGLGTPVELPKEYSRTALKAAKVFGLEVAGVDMMKTAHGPVVIEVNSSPGFEGIEKATGLNVAEMIMKHLIARGEDQKSGKKRR